MSFKVRFEGHLARALEWESARRDEDLQDLVREIVRRSSYQLLTAWRASHRDVALMEEPRSDRASFLVEEVLLKCQGPAKP